MQLSPPETDQTKPNFQSQKLVAELISDITTQIPKDEMRAKKEEEEKAQEAASKNDKKSASKNDKKKKK